MKAARSRRAWLHLLWAFDPRVCIEPGCSLETVGPKTNRCRKHYQLWWYHQRKALKQERQEVLSE